MVHTTRPGHRGGARRYLTSDDFQPYQPQEGRYVTAWLVPWPEACSNWGDHALPGIRPGSIEDDTGRRHDLRQQIKVTDIRTKQARAELAGLQDDEGIVHKPALVPRVLGQIAQPKHQARQDTGLPPVRCVGCMKPVVGNVLDGGCDRFENAGC